MAGLAHGGRAGGRAGGRGPGPGVDKDGFALSPFCRLRDSLLPTFSDQQVVFGATFSTPIWRGAEHQPQRQETAHQGPPHGPAPHRVGSNFVYASFYLGLARFRRFFLTERAGCIA